MSKNNKKFLITGVLCGLFLMNMPTYAMNNNESSKPIKKVEKYKTEDLAKNMLNLKNNLEKNFKKLIKFHEEILAKKYIKDDMPKEKKDELLKQKIIEIRELKENTINLIYEFKKKLYEKDVTLSKIIECVINSDNIYNNITDILENFGNKCEQISEHLEKNFIVSKILLDSIRKNRYIDKFIKHVTGSYKQWFESKISTLNIYYNDVLKNSYTKEKLNEIIKNVKKIEQEKKIKVLELEEKFKDENVSYYDIIEYIKQKKEPINIYVEAQDLNLKPDLPKNFIIKIERKIKDTLELINLKLKNKEETLENYINNLLQYNEKLKELYQKIINDEYYDYNKIKDRFNEKIDEIDSLADKIKKQNFSEIINDICDILKISCENNKIKKSSLIVKNEDKFSNLNNKILKKLKNNKNIDPQINKFYLTSIEMRKNISDLKSIDSNFKKDPTQKNKNINEIQDYIEILSDYHENLQNIYDELLNNKHFEFSPYDNEELTKTKNKYEIFIEKLSNQLEKIKQNISSTTKNELKNTIIKEVINKTIALMSCVIENTKDIDQYIKNYKKFEKLNEEITNINKNYEIKNISSEEFDYITKCHDLALAISKIMLNIKQFDAIKQGEINSLLTIKNKERFLTLKKNHIDYNKNFENEKDENIEILKRKILNIYEVQKKFFQILELIDPKEKIKILNPSDSLLILKNKIYNEMQIVDFLKSQNNALLNKNLSKILNILKFSLDNYYKNIKKNNNFDKNKLKQDLKNIKELLLNWNKITTGEYTDKILAILNNIEESAKEIQNEDTESEQNEIKDYILKNRKNFKNINLKENKDYVDVENLIDKIEKFQNVDETLKKIKYKICRLNIFHTSLNNIKIVEQIEKDYKEYLKKRHDNNHPFNDEELIIKGIIDKKINNFKINKQSKIDTTLNEFYEKFKNFNYSNDDINKLKEDYDNYYTKRIGSENFFNDHESELSTEISKYITNIENNFNKFEKETKENEQSMIDVKLNEFYENFKKIDYNNDNIIALQKLKESYNDYFEKRINSNKPYNDNEFKIASEISEYITNIEKLLEENTKKEKFFTKSPYENENVEDIFDLFEKENNRKSTLEDSIKDYEDFFNSRNDNNPFNEYEAIHKDNYISKTCIEPRKNDESEVYNNKSKTLKKEYINFINEKDSDDNSNNETIFDKKPEEKNEKNKIDATLKEYYEKFNKIDYNIYNITELEKLKEDYNNYYIKRINYENFFNDDESKLAEEISKYIKKIEKITKESVNKNYNKIPYKNNSNQFNKENKRLTTDITLKKFNMKFKNFDYKNYNMLDLESLKEKFEDYIGSRIDKNPLNENEKKLINKIYDKFYELKDNLYEITEEKDKKEEIDTTLKSFNKKVENFDYKNSNISDLIKLKEEIKNYLNERIKKSLDFTHEEYLIFKNIKEKIDESLKNLNEDENKFINKTYDKFENYNINIKDQNQGSFLAKFKIKKYKDEQEKIKKLENLKNMNKLFCENKKKLKEKQTQELKEKLNNIEIELELSRKQYKEAYYNRERFYMPSKIENLESLLFKKKDLLINKLFNKIQQKIKNILDVKKSLYELKKYCQQHNLYNYLEDKIESNLTTAHTIEQRISFDIKYIISFFEQLIKEYETNNSNNKKDISDLKECLEKLKNIVKNNN